MQRLGLPFLAASLVLAGCSEPQISEKQIAGNPQATPPSTAPTPKPTENSPPLSVPPPPPESVVETEVTITEQEPKSSNESAFDSNQWNSAVGLGGGAGAGGRFGGRRGTQLSERYAAIEQSGYLLTSASPMSTFAADVDTASFSNVLRQLKAGDNPITDSVRLEEFINAMRYELPQPKARQSFAVETEVTACPWNDAHELVRIAVATKEIETDKVPPCNLVFLVDVSGSMSYANKLPLLKKAFGLLIDQLRPQDRVSIVTYAAGVTVPIEGARGDEKLRLQAALQQLKSSGGTNGAGAIQEAYDLAVKHRVPGVNRVVLATDGDFNIGISSADELEAFITKKKELDVFLSVLGFGRGNLKDDRLERLANRGNGVYSYIADLATARRVLIEGFGATMMTVAKDVKLQTEWNPKLVTSFRLLGYENRALATRDFKDDKKDGGEVGAGHSVTALYEIERKADAAAGSSEPLATLRIRYKPPEGDKSREVSESIAGTVSAELSANGQVAATAAALAMHLRKDKHRGTITQASLFAMSEKLEAKRHPELAAMFAELHRGATATDSER